MRQKIKFILLLLILTSTTNLNTDPQKINHPKMLKGCIVSNQLSTVPHFKVYYQGIQTISNDDGFFTIPVEKTTENYSLLICKDFKPTFNAINTVKNLTFNTKKSHKFFVLKKATIPFLEEKIDGLEKENKPLSMRLKLIKKQFSKQSQKPESKKRDVILETLGSRKQKFEKNIQKINKKTARLKEKLRELKVSTPENPAPNFWFIEEKKVQNSNIPDDCVIVCLNPKTVAKLENWNFGLASNFVAFPKIILKNNLETRNVKRKQSITRSSLKSELYSFEKKVFHEIKKESYKPVEGKTNVKIALVR